MHSAAGIAAAAAAMQSSAGISLGSQNEANEKQSKASKDPSRISTSPKKVPESKDSPTYVQPDSSSNVVSSTINEDEVDEDFRGPERSKKNDETLKKGKTKVDF